MTNAEATSKAYWEYIQTQAPDEFKETQVIALHVHGPGMFHSANKLVKAPADLKGMKVRGPTRQVTKLLGVARRDAGRHAAAADSRRAFKGTIEACVIPWEVVPSVKVHELTKFHTEFPASGSALYTTTFVMAMNKAKYESLAPDLKKVIDANSGLATSAWLGKTQQGNDPIGRKAAVDRGNHDLHAHARRSAGVRQGCRARSATSGSTDLDKRARFNGTKLLQTART